VLNLTLTPDYIYKQLCNTFPDTSFDTLTNINRVFDKAMARMMYCISHINDKYFNVFDYLHGDQYASFLYILSTEVDSEDTAKRLYLLNKSLHGIDLYYEVKMPDIFLLVHPVGTVLGRATYDDYLIVYHNCSVGSNKDIYPQLGKYVTLHPGAMVLGSCRIGDYSRVGAGSLMIDCDLPPNSIYKGRPKYYSVSYSSNMPDPRWG